MIIFSLETSCDETACAVLKYENGSFSILSNIVSSQVKIHAKWGGVVPNLAAREHLKNILPVIKQALQEAKVQPKEINFLSVTNQPGLIPALLIGTSVAKTLAYLWQKPLIGIHHLEGHIYANFIDLNLNSQKINFPLLSLVVSGGHTQLVFMKKHLDYQIIGETLDDAVGEAFDKVARILSLGYPGGPLIAEKARLFKSQPTAHYQFLKVPLPRPMIRSDNLNFSFSGLKTAVLYETKKNKTLLKNKDYINELCNEFQQATIDVLIFKTLRAIEKYRPQTVLLAGGVAANQELQKQLATVLKEKNSTLHFIAPPIQYCGDNATMIGVASYFRWKNMTNQQKEQSQINWKTLQTKANARLKN